MGKQTKEPEALNDLQERFCQEYLKDLHVTKAAIRAGYSEETAAQQGSRLLRHVKVSKRIATLKAEQFGRLQVESDDILRELSRIGYSDIRTLYNDDGTIKSPKDWPEELARAIASIEVDEIFEGHGADRTWTGYTKKVKFWPKDRGLELLGKHKKLFTEKHEHSVTKLEDLIGGSRALDKPKGET